MADLYLDAAAFEELRATLRQIRELLERPGRQLAAIDESGMGPAVLRARMGEFAEEWAYGIGRLGQLADGAESALGEVERVFREVDTALAGGSEPGVGR